jgi:hypothetical protein
MEGPMNVRRASVFVVEPSVQVTQPDNDSQNGLIFNFESYSISFFECSSMPCTQAVFIARHSIPKHRIPSFQGRNACRNHLEFVSLPPRCASHKSFDPRALLPQQSRNWHHLAPPWAMHNNVKPRAHLSHPSGYWHRLPPP